MTSSASQSPFRCTVGGGAGVGKSALVAGLQNALATARRSYLIAETAAGAAQELLTGAPIPDLSLIVADVAQGLEPETRRLAFLAGLLGVRQVVLAVNKMDRAGYAQDAFARVEQPFRALAAELGLTAVSCVPIAAARGDNLAGTSAAMPWYQGPPLRELLERAEAFVPLPASQGAEVADQFEATVVWAGAAPLLPGRSYLLRGGGAGTAVAATVAPLKYLINPASAQRMAAARLRRDEIGVVNLQLERAITFDPYRANHDTGRFILIDSQSQETVGAGILHFALRRARNIVWQALDVNKAVRAAAKGQQPCVLWYTGLSGAGKSTIANLVDRKLHSQQRHTYLLDGDNVRHGLNRDLGFTDTDRVENIRRIAEVAKLMVDAGLIVGTAFISPFRAERQTARALLAPGEFIEVFIDTPLEVAEGRDPKGLYKKARRGDLKNFTGIDSPYEAPQSPEIRIDTTATSPDAAAELIVGYLRQRGMLGPA